MTTRQRLVITAAARLRKANRFDRIAVDEALSTNDWSRELIETIEKAEQSSRAWKRLQNDIVKEARS